MSKYHQGKYKPEYPKKYQGDVHNIVYRSGYEKKAFLWADRNPNILKWSSEETVIPYLHNDTNKIRRYFVDLTLQYKQKDGSIVTYLCEIKPYTQTIEPKPPKRITPKSKANFAKQIFTYRQNLDKWHQAQKFCEKHNMTFILLTEKELGIKR